MSKFMFFVLQSFLLPGKKLIDSLVLWFAQNIKTKLEISSQNMLNYDLMFWLNNDFMGVKKIFKKRERKKNQPWPGIELETLALVFLRKFQESNI